MTKRIRQKRKVQTAKSAASTAKMVFQKFFNDEKIVERARQTGKSTMFHAFVRAKTNRFQSLLIKLYSVVLKVQ